MTVHKVGAADLHALTGILIIPAVQGRVHMSSVFRRTE